MIKQIKFRNTVWLDLNSPTAEDIQELAEKYKLPTLVAHELLAPSHRSKVDLYDDFIYLVLDFPLEHLANGLVNREEGGDHKRGASEVDFVLGKDFLITVHYERIQPLEEFALVLEANSLANRRKNEAHAGFLFYYLIRQLYESLSHSLEYFNDNLRRAEQRVFAGHHSEMVKTLSIFNHHILDFKWSFKWHREILASLELAGQDLYGEKFAYYLRAISGEYTKVWNILEDSREIFDELRNTNESLLNIRSNEIMKFLTVMAFIFIPLGLIAAIFGMSGTEANMPIIKEDGGFFFILFLMGLVGILMYTLVKFKRWL